MIFMVLFSNIKIGFVIVLPPNLHTVDNVNLPDARRKLFSFEDFHTQNIDHTQNSIVACSQKNPESINQESINQESISKNQSVHALRSIWF